MKPNLIMSESLILFFMHSLSNYEVHVSHLFIYLTICHNHQMLLHTECISDSVPTIHLDTNLQETW